MFQAVWICFRNIVKKFQQLLQIWQIFHKLKNILDEGNSKNSVSTDWCLFCQFSWCWMIGWIEIKAAAGWWWWWWRFTDSVSCYECILWSIKQCEHHSSVQLEEKKYLIRKQIDGLNAVRNSSSLSSSSSSSSSSCKQKKKANSKRSHDTKTINSNINMFKILKSISAERVQRSTHSTESKSLYRRIIID